MYSCTFRNIEDIEEKVKFFYVVFRVLCKLSLVRKDTYFDREAEFIALAF
jgi:hypothetical protein